MNKDEAMKIVDLFLKPSKSLIKMILKGYELILIYDNWQLEASNKETIVLYNTGHLSYRMALRLSIKKLYESEFVDVGAYI